MKGAKLVSSHMQNYIIPCLPCQSHILLESYAKGDMKFSLLEDVPGRNRVARPLGNSQRRTHEVAGWHTFARDSTFPTLAPPAGGFSLRWRVQFLKPAAEIGIPPKQHQEAFRMKLRPQRARETRFGDSLVEFVLIR